MSTAISIRLPNDLVRELDALAERENCPRAQIIREAIHLYLRDHDVLIAMERLKDKDNFIDFEKALKGRLDSKD